MKRHRGFGRVYRPTYRDKRTREIRTCETYWISFPHHGKQIKENAHTTKEAEAWRLLKQRNSDVTENRPVGPRLERTTLDDLLKLVSDDYVANGRRSAGHLRFRFAHLREHFGRHRKARDITTEAITGYKAERLNQKAKPATINNELAALRRGFRLGRNIVPARPDFDMLHVDNARKGFFEREQYEAVRRHLPQDLKPVMDVTYITGWRTKSELLTRQWKHVDLENGWLRLEPGESKNGEGREFPLTPELRTILEEQRDRVREIQRATGQIIPWVFVHFHRPDGRVVPGDRVKVLVPVQN